MIETNFASAHQLRGYKGECEKLHGHNWKVQVYVLAERLNDIDIALDFHILRGDFDHIAIPHADFFGSLGVNFYQGLVRNSG